MDQRLYGSIRPTNHLCYCGARFGKKFCPVNQVRVPVCEACGELAEKLTIQRRAPATLNGSTYTIRYHRDGSCIRSVQEAIMVSQQVEREHRAGTFNLDNYRKNKDLMMGDFITTSFLAKYKYKEHEAQYIRDFIAPYFEDVKTFRATQGHIEDFIKTFMLRTKEATWVRGVYKKILDEVLA